jgi:hypothetical protein
VIGFVIAAAFLPSCHRPCCPQPTSGFHQSGIDGGGFVNVVTFDPSGSGVVLAGGDVSGILRSSDFGATWAPSNTGVEGLDQLKVASILFSPRVPGEVYAAVGDEGRTGALLVSTDDGRSWSLRSDVPRFSGGNNDGTPLPPRHPRSTGTLLAADTSSNVLYAATFDAGVMRSSDDGRTWTTLGLAGSYLRSVALDPADPQTLYVSAFDDAVYKTTTASTAGSMSRLTGSPPDAEELAIVGSDLYAAAGRGGLAVSADGGSTWHSLRAGGGTDGDPVWETIAGYEACGHAVLYAGTDSGGADSLVRSLDSGATWTSVVERSRILTEEGGPNGHRWWLASLPQFMFGGSNYTTSQIALDPRVPPTGTCVRSRLLVAGRSGVWGTTDAGRTWYPMVRGMAVTIVHEVAVDPAATGRVFAAVADWGLLSSTNAGANVTVHPAGGTGFGLALDTASHPQAVYLGTGLPDENSGGDVLVRADPLVPRWRRTGLISSAGGRVVAIAERSVAGRPVLLAAVDGQGVWRKDGDGPWTEVAAAAVPTPAGGGGVSFAWPGGSTVYVYDRQTGLWRSSDAGLTWTPIWTKRSGPPFTGSIAADPTEQRRLFVSIGDDGVYRLDDASSGTVEGGDIAPNRVGAFAHPGPVTVGRGGVVFAAELAVDGPPDLLRSSDHGTTWRSIADDAYRASATLPLGLTESGSGELFVCLDGNGLLIGRSES